MIHNGVLVEAVYVGELVRTLEVGLEAIQTFLILLAQH